MLAALDGDERRVLLAHEAAHLNHRHHLYVHLVEREPSPDRSIALSELAAAVNPLLAAVPSVVRTSVERWADEDAAVAVGDREITARAVAKAGLATATATRRPSAPPLLTIAGGPVVAPDQRAAQAPTSRAPTNGNGCPDRNPRAVSVYIGDRRAVHRTSLRGGSRGLRRPLASSPCQAGPHSTSSQTGERGDPQHCTCG
ncbi:hypothetical protein OG558_22650 [Kribbella sp. NBC_01510]|uniref:hypothetical protein n=1 Tax=Kribbella sp. NBC_01510 TaxID=2903581 RepID=UPI00386536A2